MKISSASAVGHPNIAFIKYWGNQNDALRLPVNGSISMNLAGLETRTTVTFNAALSADVLNLNGAHVTGGGLERVSRFLDHVRNLAGINTSAEVISNNNFPTGAGIASSAAGFSALALAASRAAGLQLTENELSRLARLGSGSASRSVPGGYVEWKTGNDAESYAVSIAPENHWDLVDCIAVLAAGHKPVGSTAGHSLANTSPFQAARVAGAPARLDQCRQALLERNFSSLAQVVEFDSNLMHAVMMTSMPALFYWEPASIAIMKLVPVWREKDGLNVCYTLDAGPNVHLICTAEHAEEISARLQNFPGVMDILRANVGGPARYI